MKKVFTLALVMLVTLAGYSQLRQVSYKDADKKVATMQVTKGLENSLENVQSQPNMTRTDGELDYTYYDWQTNCGIINRTIVWPDGKVNFAFTVAGNQSYSDRGTAIGTYDSEADQWIPLGGRIESEKTGFGSIARYKENGIVIASHNASTIGIFIVEDRDQLADLQGAVDAALYIPESDIEPTWANVMTSGPERNIIHVLYTSYSQDGSPMYYARSIDGGSTWDKVDEVFPFISNEYFSDWGSNIAYWLETTDDNRLAFVVNNAWSDGMIVYSYDNGETWERKVFYHHPGINTTYDAIFMYPRWVSAQWEKDGEIAIAYEFNGSTGEPGSNSYYPGIGGVAFWSESLPYYGQTLEYEPDPTNPKPMQPGQPFIIDTAYLYNDIYASWWLWSDASHEMWPEYMGYLPALTPDLEVEPDPYDVQEFNIGTDTDLHGAYNCGPVAMPTLCVVPGSNGSDLVAVWSAMDEESDTDGDNYFYKLFASYSPDFGRTWLQQKHLTTDFMFTSNEFVYTQAAVVGTTLVIAAMTDNETGTEVQGDDNVFGNTYYQGFTFELEELFPGVAIGVPEMNHSTHMDLFPNPATSQLQVVLSQNADIVIYNMMGQKVMSVKGNAGANTINISELNAGVYFVNAGNDTQKLIVK